MTMLRHFFDQAWRWKFDLPEIELPSGPNHPSLESLRETEWNLEFVERMQNRVVMGS